MTATHPTDSMLTDSQARMMCAALGLDPEDRPGQDAVSTAHRNQVVSDLPLPAWDPLIDRGAAFSVVRRGRITYRVSEYGRKLLVTYYAPPTRETSAHFTTHTDREHAVTDLHLSYINDGDTYRESAAWGRDNLEKRVRSLNVSHAERLRFATQQYDFSIFCYVQSGRYPGSVKDFEVEGITLEVAARCAAELIEELSL